MSAVQTQKVQTQMKSLIVVLAMMVMIGLFATACEPSSDPTPSPVVSSPPGNQRVEVGLGESVELPDMAIGVFFDRVVEDSRCPANVQCIWAGQVVIELTVTEADTRSAVRVSLEPGSGIESPWTTIATSRPDSEDISIRLIDLVLSPASANGLEDAVPTAVLEAIEEGG